MYSEDTPYGTSTQMPYDPDVAYGKVGALWWPTQYHSTLKEAVKAVVGARQGVLKKMEVFTGDLVTVAMVEDGKWMIIDEDELTDEMIEQVTEAKSEADIVADLLGDDEEDKAMARNVVKDLLGEDKPKKTKPGKKPMVKKAAGKKPNGARTRSTYDDDQKITMLSKHSYEPRSGSHADKALGVLKKSSTIGKFRAGLKTAKVPVPMPVLLRIFAENKVVRLG